MGEIAADYGRSKLNRWKISVDGLRKCQAILNELVEIDVGSNIYEAALSFAVIIYARPFSGNEKEQSAKADCNVQERDVKGSLSKQERLLHQKLIDLRNKALAHAEWGTHQTKVEADGSISTVPFSLSSEIPETEVRQFANLVDKLIPEFVANQGAWLCYVQAYELSKPVGLRE